MSTIVEDSGTQKRAREVAEDLDVIETSVSPDLRKTRKSSNMKRTPQPALTQSKLTSMLNHQPSPKPAGTGTEATVDVDAGNAEKMDTSTAAVPAQPKLTALCPAGVPSPAPSLPPPQ